MTPLDIYVASTGNDANPGTPVQPVLTMAGAFNRVRDANGNLTYQLGAPVRIHIAAFPDLEWVPIPGYQAINEDGQVVILCDGALQPGEDGFVFPPVAAGAAGVGTSNVSVAFVCPSDDVYLGYTIEFTSGPAAGQRRKIRNNTTSAIIPDLAFSPAPVGGDNFRVVVPATNFDISAGSVDFQVSSDLYATLVNANFLIGEVSPQSLRLNGLNCVKMFGCSFSQEAHLSVFNSKLYAGVTEADAGVVQEDIRINELWAALGGAQPWAGWGISCPDAHLNSDVQPLNDFTGYLVSRGYLLIGSAGTSDAVKLLGGSVLGGVNCSNSELGLWQHEGQGIPVLLRNTETTHVLAGLDSRVFVQGGDNAVTFDGTFDTIPNRAELYMVSSELTWEGPWTQTITDGLVFAGIGGASTFLLNGIDQNIDLTLLATTLFSSGFALTNGHKCLIDPQGGGANFNIHHGDTATSTVGLTVALTASIGTGGEQENNAVYLSQDQAVPNATYIGVLAAELANVTFYAATIQSPNTGIICQESSTVQMQSLSVSSASNLALQASVNSQILGTTDITVDSQQAGVDIEQGSTISAPTVNITSAGSYAATLGDNGHLTGQSVNATCTAPGLPAILALYASHVTSTFPGTIQGDGPALQGFMGSTFDLVQPTLQSNSDTAVKVSSGAQFNSALPTIVAALDGVDCTGGGQANFIFTTLFGNPVFTCGRNELVVGPGPLEQASYAVALPSSGDSFSNAGAGSFINRD